MGYEGAMQHGQAAGIEAAGMMAQLATWPQHTAEIMAGIGGQDLPRALDRSLAQLVSFDMTVIFAYPDGARPLYLHDGFYGHVPGQALGRYLSGAYLLDPFYTACIRRVRPGLYRMRELAPDAFFVGEYVNSPEVHPCISLESGSLAEEIGVMVPLAAGFMASYSLMRSHGRPPFSEAEMRLLRHVEPVVRQAIQLHWKDLRASGSPNAEAGRAAEMERAFESFAPELLSRQEQRVVQMILRGHSSLSIAASLGIAEGTVKNHRKSIYAKLEISSQQELFTRFIRHLFG
ncbi:helix-turn-helix transcriptional regulator [Acidisoma sp. 7E03]